MGKASSRVAIGNAGPGDRVDASDRVNEGIVTVAACESKWSGRSGLYLESMMFPLAGAGARLQV